MRPMEILLALLLGLLVGAAAGHAWSRRVPSAAAPVAAQIGRLEELLQGVEVQRARTLGELQEQVAGVRRTSEMLGRETSALVDALRRPQVRGRWGELQLRTVVEHAGMLDRCDFVEQPVLADGSRPDLVVRLGAGRTVVVDAKVSLAAYLEAVDAPDEDAREARLVAHARHLRAHVERLGTKAYWEQLPSTPEFVVLFVPGEAMLAPALERDPGLLEDAYRRGVHLATPTTLLSLLRAVAHGWQQQELADSAREVVSAGRELHRRLATLGAHVDKLGRSLGTAVSDFNKTVGSLERTVLPASRRLVACGLDDQPQVPAQVDGLPRPLSAPELVDDRLTG